MAGLTWTDEKGNWGVVGLDWREVGEQRPKVYVGLFQLKDMEPLADRIAGEDDEAAVAAVMQLSGMGRKGGAG